MPRSPIKEQEFEDLTSDQQQMVAQIHQAFERVMAKHQVAAMVQLKAEKKSKSGLRPSELRSLVDQVQRRVDRDD
jgi:hypothetical protein